MVISHPCLEAVPLVAHDVKQKLWRLPRGGKVSRKQVQARFDAFNTGAWRSFIDDSMRAAHQAFANASRKRRRERGDDLDRCARRAM